MKTDQTQTDIKDTEIKKLNAKLPDGREGLKADNPEAKDVKAVTQRVTPGTQTPVMKLDQDLKGHLADVKEEVLEDKPSRRPRPRPIERLINLEELKWPVYGRDRVQEWVDKQEEPKPFIMPGIRDDSFHHSFKSVKPKPTPLKDLLKARNLPASEEVYTQNEIRQFYQGISKPSISKFSGIKEDYEDWRMQFEVFIHQARIPAKHKMVQLKNSLRGKAAALISNLGFGEAQYKLALKKLDDRYGGDRRQLNSCMEKLKAAPKPLLSDVNSLAEFSDLLSDVVVRIADSGRGGELEGDSTSYNIVIQKVPESLMMKYYDTLEEDDGLLNFAEWLGSYINKRLELHDLKGGSISKKPDQMTYKPKSKTFSTQKNKANDKQKDATQLSTTTTSSNKDQCPICKKQHGLTSCQLWKSKSASERWDQVKTAKICFGCLGHGHQLKNCPKKSTCSIQDCKKLHHPDLHYDVSQSMKVTVPTSHSANTGLAMSKVSPIQMYSTFQSFIPVTDSYVALRLLPVYVTSGEGRRILVNALLDEGSDTSYIRADVAESLGLKGKSGKLDISAVSSSSTTTSQQVEVFIESVDAMISKKITTWTMPSLCQGLKLADWNKLKKLYQHLDGIEFGVMPGRRTVDLLLGSDYPEFGLCLEEIVGNPDEPVARKTPLGWTCVGRVFRTDKDSVITNVFTGFQRIGASSTSMDEDLRRLWNQDLTIAATDKESWSPDDVRAFDRVSSQRTFLGDRYQVPIPWKEERPNLLDNRSGAMRRLHSLEITLRRRGSEVVQRYCQAFQDNVDKKYIIELSTQEASTPGWYLPHFPVIKEEKETTKVRIVYDAAAVFENKSLNGEMLSGPNLQRDILEILVKFRSKPIVLIADIKEMFNQVVMAPEDRPYHRLLWRGMETDAAVRTYQAQRLMFGDRASPFLAMFVLRQHAVDVKDRFPQASAVIEDDVYMDDVISSFECPTVAKQVRKDLQEITLQAGFFVRRWASNDQTVLEGVPEEDRATVMLIQEPEASSMKTLGVWWDSRFDKFLYEVKRLSAVRTKRELLKQIAVIYDPIQFLAPLLITGKMLLQRAWLAGCSWDDQLPSELMEASTKWIDELANLSEVRLTRCLRSRPNVEIENTTLHVFCDASKDAYGTVAYARFQYSDTNEVSLVAARTRVAPLRTISIPRLELMAAVNGIRLAQVLRKVLQMSAESITYWTDSTDVLYWIKGQSRTYKPFIANRVSEIHEFSTPQQWRHVPTKENPADDLSRGLKASEMRENCRWCKGPGFLLQSEDEWPVKQLNGLELSEEGLGEMPKAKAVTCCGSAASQGIQSILQVTRFSSFIRLKRVLAWVLRFVKILRRKDVKEASGVPGILEVIEMKRAEKLLIREVQAEAFPKILKSSGADCGKLRTLTPFVDAEGLLRVGGRLQNAGLSYDVQHPLILPSSSHLSVLIIRQAHKVVGHGRGTNEIWAEVKQRFWILNGREAVKKLAYGCYLCRRQKETTSQIMAPLPEGRCRPLKAFMEVGVDYAGPFTVKLTRRCSAKRYLCLFTCLASRAVHLEMAYSMDTPSFLMAFSRMIARRGKPEKVTSDNGSNFVGSENELKELVAALDHVKIANDLASQEITWDFNPPEGSHHGGIFESLVKSSKRCLYAVLRLQRLTDEELITAITEVEGILNSRPLQYVGCDPQDEPVLTPNHFLMGQLGGQLAPVGLEELAFDPRHRWRLVQDLMAKFWKRWTREYLVSLQPRGKWDKVKDPVKEGDVVLLTSNQTPRGLWPLARVVETFPGEDGFVRTVKVLARGKEFMRPITKLIPLVPVGEQ